tara:strand:- start:140 stop:718 length:579 start_codon:yes stop_codon:yes gene_type:complete
MKYIMIPALCLLTGVASANECKYTTDVDTSFEGVISKSQNYDKKTYPYIDDTRKCVVSMDVQINDNWHPTSGTYVFGPDTSENDACKNAELSAKESILRTTVPEKLKKTMEQKCKVGMTDITGDKVEPPAPKASPTIPVQQAPVDAPIPPMPPVMAYNNPYLLGDILPVCEIVNMVVWIDGREQLAWKEICQ